MNEYKSKFLGPVDANCIFMFHFTVYFYGNEHTWLSLMCLHIYSLEL